ncbi:hypothetical protein [Amycolatopsis lexingtonensis]|uniref:hypothetical protein n=1 Tax=Amycolatopsis lexingtonensis TaxID=218822 RepID=UPI003F6F4458
MTDLERKLADALREEADKVTPNLDAAWAEQLRRQHRPSRRRRGAVWLAPLAAVLVVLTSVAIATQVNTDPGPVQPAVPGRALLLPGPVVADPMTLSGGSTPVALTEFAGQTDRWTSYAVTATDPTGTRVFCIEALHEGATHGAESQYGLKSPSCVPISAEAVRSGYVGESGGPLPAGKAVYLAEPLVQELWLYDVAGDLSRARAVGVVGADRVFLADVKPGSPPVRFEVNPTQAHPASR